MIEYRIADQNDAKKLAKLSADAYMTYPLYQVIRKSFRSDERYYRFLCGFQSIFIKTAIKRQTVFVGMQGDVIVSMAILESPEQKEPGIVDYIKTGGLRLMRCLRPSLLFRFVGFAMGTSKECEEIEKPRWHVASLAVDPAFQGMHLGSKMLQDCIIPYVREHGGKLLTLTTNTEQNSRFYQKNGFTEFDKRELHWQGQAIDNWSFRMGASDLSA